MNVYACLFVPDFPVQAVLRAEPELRSQAVAVIIGRAPLQTVLARNEAARNAGVHPGMSKLELESCGGITLRQQSTSQETAAHAALLDCAQAFSPRIEDIACDTLLIDVTGLEALFGPLPHLARKLKDQASRLGLAIQVAIASNPDTAMLAARGFFAITIIPPEKEPAMLGPLSLEVLAHHVSNCAHDGDNKLFDTLQRWGMRTLRDLAALPQIALSERLGQPGLHLQMLARGETQRMLVPSEPALTFEETFELEHPITLLDPLAFVLHRLLDQLCERLQARALAAQELRLRLHLDSGCADDSCTVSTAPSIFLRTLHLPTPMRDAQLFLKLLQLDLRAHAPGAPIVKVHLAAEPARPRAVPTGLFLPPSPEPEKLELTLAKIAAIVGEDKVGSVELLDTHRPEAFHMKHFAPPVADPLNEKHPPTFVTAMRIFRPSRPVNVSLENGNPSRLNKLPIVWTAGPWRTSGDWWEPETWSHDEWDIAVPEGDSMTLYRLAHDLIHGTWFLQGTYD